MFYGLFVCIFIYKTIKIQDLGHVFMEGAKTYVNILFVIAAATAFARCLTLLRYPQTISESVLAVSNSKVVILLIMNAIMLVCGMIIDNIPQHHDSHSHHGSHCHGSGGWTRCTSAL